MQKIIVIGCPGAGKTTFAQKLCDKSGLPLFHLDAIWHKADRTHISREEFDARLGEILAKDAWIIDGNYSRTLERRLTACDTVVLFDLPVELCLAGAVARVGQKRPDMPWIETEEDAEFTEFIKKFNKQQRPQILELLKKHHDKHIFVFQSRMEADMFLNEKSR